MRFIFSATTIFYCSPQNTNEILGILSFKNCLPQKLSTDMSDGSVNSIVEVGDMPPHAIVGKFLVRH